jgi:membrane protein
VLENAVGRAFPRQLEFLTGQLHQMATSPLNLSLIGTIVMIWDSMGVFGAVTSAVNHAWGVERSYGFFKHKLIAFLMMMAAGAVAVIALVLISAAQVVEAHWFSSILLRFPGLDALGGLISRNLPTPMFIFVVGLIYYFAPNAQVRLRDVWFGAILAGLLWRAAFAGFAWYVRDLSRFSIHGSVAAVVVFLVWVYVSAVILLYGVEVTAAYARLRKHLPQAAPAAPVRE